MTPQEEFAHALRQASADLSLARTQMGLALVKAERTQLADGRQRRLNQPEPEAVVLRLMIGFASMIEQTLGELLVTSNSNTEVGVPPRSSQR